MLLLQIVSPICPQVPKYLCLWYRQWNSRDASLSGRLALTAARPAASEMEKKEASPHAPQPTRNCRSPQSSAHPPDAIRPEGVSPAHRSAGRNDTACGDKAKARAKAFECGGCGVRRGFFLANAFGVRVECLRFRRAKGKRGGSTTPVRAHPVWRG